MHRKKLYMLSVHVLNKAVLIVQYGEKEKTDCSYLLYVTVDLEMFART